MPSRAAALGFGTALTLARFVVICLALELATLLGVPGWYAGLFVNAMCVAFAVAVVTWLRMWSGSGVATLWRSKRAALLLLPFIAEAVVWAIYPGGMEELAPGYGLWALTLLMVGVNEELVSRVAILGSLRKAYRAGPAAVLTGTLFGLQHLSQLVITSRAIDDVAANVLLSGVYGFALAAYQLRFAWLLPLILTHALADSTAITTGGDAPVAMYVVVHVALLAYGIALLRRPGESSRPTGEPLLPRRARGRSHP